MICPKCEKNAGKHSGEEYERDSGTFIDIS